MDNITIDAIIIELCNKKIITVSRTEDICFNFNNLISYPYLNNNIIKLIYNKLKGFSNDNIVGNITKHYASILSHNYDINLILFSDNNIKKIYGKNEPGQNCTILVDNIYKAQTLKKYMYFIKKLGLSIENIIVLCNNGFTPEINVKVNFHYILDIEHIRYIISLHRNIDNKKFLEYRNNFMIKKSISNKILEICRRKKTRIGIDCSKKNIKDIIKIIEITGGYISMFFVNSYIIDNFSDKYGAALKSLSDKYDFILVNNICLADISLINNNIYEWCNLVTIIQHFNSSSINTETNLKFIVNSSEYDSINKIDYMIRYNNKNIIGYKNSFIGDSQYIRITPTINNIDYLKKKHHSYDIIIICDSLINHNKSASDSHLLLNYINNQLF